MNLVYIHKDIGEPRAEQIAAAVECAQLHSPSTPVVVLTNPVSAAGEAYEKIFDFQQAHGTGRAYNLACILRWLYLYDYMRANDLSEIFQGDNDVLVFHDLEQDLDWFRQFDYPISTDPANGSTSAHVTHVKLQVLESFVSFLKQRNGVESGDMNVWRHFRKQLPHLACGETNQIRDGAIYSHGMHSPAFWSGLFEVNPLLPTQPLPTLLMTWHEGHPYLRVKDTGQLIRAKTLHCCGGAKTDMRRYVEMSKASLVKDIPWM